jgi:hypothetical protein
VPLVDIGCSLVDDNDFINGKKLKFGLPLHRSAMGGHTSRREPQGALEPLGAMPEAPVRCARAAGTSHDSRASARPVRGRQRSRAAPPAAANGTRSHR